MTTRSQKIVAALTILLASFGMAPGQRTGSGGTVTEKPKPVKPKPAEEPTQKTRAAVKIITRYVEKPVTPLTGRLFVVAETGAVILIEPLDLRNAEAQKGTVPEGERGLIFNDLRPGNYRVAATLAGYHETEKASVEVKRNESQTVTLNFEAILYSVTINTNVDGELKYGKEGQIPNSVKIQNKSITLHLSAGDYEAEVEAAEPVYKTERQKFPVTSNTTVEIRLKLIEFSKETLRADWTDTELKNWEVPAGWRASSGNLIVKGAGIALPRDESKRYYKDFQVISDVKITNGIGAAFVLRAQDSKNYYLLQLTGEQADEPFYVRLFVVKNGVEQRIQALKIPSTAASALKAGQFFSVQIKVTDNRIAVAIVDNQSATDYPLGVLIDSNRNFAAGAAGIVARSNEESVVWRFIVCTECPKD